MIDATIGGASSNSYITVANADIYFGERLHCSDWTDATPTNKEKALIQATRILDEYCIWLGIKEDTATPQALEWPRIGICHDGAIYYEYDVAFYQYDTFSDGYWILDSDTIPQKILDGTCELALVLLGRDTQSDATLSSLNIAGLKMDLAKSSNKGYEIIPSYVWQIVSPLGELRGSSGTVKLLRC